VFPGLTPRHDPPRLLVVVAHPDDETFGCGSLLLAAAARGWRTSVACATRGEAGEATPGTDSSRPLGEVREDELRAAAEVLGVHDVQLLGFADSGMEGQAAAGTLVAAEAVDVAAAVAASVESVDPDVLVTLDGSDGHRDHVAIREATISVARERGLPCYLQCLPRSLMDRWVAHISTIQPDLIYLRNAELGTADDEITLTIDTSEHYQARLRAGEAHASQAPPYAALPEDLTRAFLTREHLREVT
jgi:LmbE family N-acetylglucosaminyl deacetylase